MSRTETPASRNESWGFFGTMDRLATEAWPLAVAAIAAATGCDAEEVAVFLDSTDGRHFADQVRGGIWSGATLQDAINRAVECWMGWRIGRSTARRHGIPAGMPYLTGFVVHRAIRAESSEA